MKNKILLGLLCGVMLLGIVTGCGNKENNNENNNSTNNSTVENDKNNNSTNNSTVENDKNNNSTNNSTVENDKNNNSTNDSFIENDKNETLPDEEIPSDLVQDSKLETIESSAKMYFNMVEYVFAMYYLENMEPMGDGVYTVDEDGNLVRDGKIVTIEVSSENRPDAGSKILIKSGFPVGSNETKLNYGPYTVTFDEYKQPIVK